MKKIGFIDYYLDCWHAHCFTEKLALFNKEFGDCFEVSLAYAEIDSPHGMTTDEWCKAHNIPRAMSIKEVCESCDYIAIFAPDNPEKHLEYAKEVFTYGKPTFIDKTFSVGYDDAVEIFSLAERYGVKFFSTSSLRYDEAYRHLKGKASAVTVLGGGGEGHYFDDYLVHHLEIVMHVFGLGATAVSYHRCADQEIVKVEFTNGRIANIIFAPCLAFEAIISDENGRSARYPAMSDFFKHQIYEVLSFFNGEPLSFDTRETLELAKIKWAAFKSRDEKIARVIL